MIIFLIHISFVKIKHGLIFVERMNCIILSIHLQCKPVGGSSTYDQTERGHLKGSFPYQKCSGKGTDTPAYRKEEFIGCFRNDSSKSALSHLIGNGSNIPIASTLVEIKVIITLVVKDKENADAMVQLYLTSYMQKWEKSTILNLSIEVIVLVLPLEATRIVCSN